MSPITKLDINELDKRIDSTVTSQRLLRLSREVALIHLLRYFEDYLRLYLLKMSQGPMGYGAAAKKAQDGVHFAIWWIFQHCPYTVQQRPFATQGDAYLQAHELLEAAMNYSTVWDFM